MFYYDDINCQFDETMVAEWIGLHGIPFGRGGDLHQL